MHIHLRDGVADGALLHKTLDVEHFKCFYCDQSEAIKGLRVAEVHLGASRTNEHRLINGGAEECVCVCVGRGGGVEAFLG